MKSFIFFILVASSISSVYSQNLLFRSGFEPNVQLNPPATSGGQWYQSFSGQDQGYDWSTHLPARSSFWQYLVDNDSVLADYVEVSIDTVVGPDGNTTNALFMQIKKYSPTNFDGQFSTVRDQYVLKWDTARQKAYCKYWMKFQPDLYNVMPAGTSRWRYLMEWRESGGINGDYRWAFSVQTNRNTDSLFWKFETQYITGPQTFRDDWSVINTTTAVPVGEWFLLEVFWDQQPDNTGRIWIAVNGAAIFDERRDNENDSAIDHWHIFKAYTGKESIDSGSIYQWIDNMEIWDDLPRTTSIASPPNNISSEYALIQNYPNPFNPSTTIRFALPQREHVKLKVFDVNGREIATLVDGEMPAGKHAVTFAPRAATTGLYFYKLTAGQFSQTRKAVLMK